MKKKNKNFHFFYLEIQQLLPEILFQLGPKQTQNLLKKVGGLKQKVEKINEEGNEEDEDVPALVNENFEDISKKN